MQTFIVSKNMQINASLLDNKRLGKQRVEAIQILKDLLIKETRWKNHPAIKMWKGYEQYLLYEYLKNILNEWENRGFKNDKCKEWYNLFIKLLPYKEKKKIPKWLDEDFILKHKSNLLRKNKKYYEKYFNNIPDNLKYRWN